ncbi:unnamed protein product, partial [Mesorhabditis spiculigera]
MPLSQMPEAANSSVESLPNMSRSSTSMLEEPLLPVDRRIGKDRRRFVVISVFDFTFTALLWLLWTVSKSDDWKAAFLQEINILNPEFLKQSLFDLVVVALLRFLILLTVYSLCRSDSWIPVAFTTSATTIYLIIKILFFFSKEQAGVPQYLIILCSFLISWFELWLMPFRVLAREREYGSDQESVVAHSRASTPGRPPGIRRRPQYATTSADEFHSAVDYTSDEEQNSAPGYFRIPKGTMVRNPQTRKNLEQRLNSCMLTVGKLLVDARSGQWRVARKPDPQVLQSAENAFYVTSTIPNAKAEQVFDAVWKKTTAWNDQVLNAQTIQSLDENTEVFFSTSAPAMRGYVASRAFADIRRIVRGEPGVISGYFVDCADVIQPNGTHPCTIGNIVGAANGPSMIRVTQGENDCQIEWMMQCDLKGGLPKRIINTNMVRFFVTYMEKLNIYLTAVAETSRIDV